MGRFNVETYSPEQDSSHSTRQLRPKLAGIILHQRSGACPCGCDQMPLSNGRTFRMGHDARLRGRLLRAHLASQPVNYIDENGAVKVSSALNVAKQHGWDAYLADAKSRQNSRSSNSHSSTQSGPQIGDRRTIKVGRWSYEGQIVGRSGSEIEVEYQPKSGGPKRVRLALS